MNYDIALGAIMLVAAFVIIVPAIDRWINTPGVAPVTAFNNSIHDMTLAITAVCGALYAAFDGLVGTTAKLFGYPGVKDSFDKLTANLTPTMLAAIGFGLALLLAWAKTKDEKGA